MLIGLLRSRQTKYGMFKHLYTQVRGACVPSFRYPMLKRGLGVDMAFSSNHRGTSLRGRSFAREAKLVRILPIPPNQVFINLNLNGKDQLFGE